MKLVVIAATGGIGRHAVQQAVEAGHEVTAVARNPTQLPVGVRRVVTADLSVVEASSLQSAFAGTDAVLSGLGPRSRADTGITSRGTKVIVEAMRAAGVRRLVAVSAAPIGTVPSPARPKPPRYDPGDRFVMRHLLNPMIKAVFRDHYADLAVMEDTLADSGLDWTVLRPPRLTDKPMSHAYRTAYGQNLPRGMFVSRADVAHYMLWVLDRPHTIEQAIGIAN
jgi:uncharacterized protein YbjT (DUF2867 family)